MLGTAEEIQQLQSTMSWSVFFSFLFFGQYSFSTGCTMVLCMRSITDFNNNGHVRKAHNS